MCICVSKDIHGRSPYNLSILTAEHGVHCVVLLKRHACIIFVVFVLEVRYNVA
jgi:hypothetical protein